MRDPYSEIHDASESLTVWGAPFLQSTEPCTAGRRVVEIPVTVSVGIAVGFSPEQSAEDLIRHADAAMYQAKEAGKARASSSSISSCTKMQWSAYNWKPIFTVLRIAVNCTWSINRSSVSRTEN